MIYIGVAICVLVCAAVGFGMTAATGKAVEAVARQPEASGKIQTNMILTAAFVEGCALFAIVACAFLIK